MIKQGQCTVTGITFIGSVSDDTEISYLSLSWVANTQLGIYIGQSTILGNVLPDIKGNDILTLQYSFGSIDKSKNPDGAHYLRGG